MVVIRKGECKRALRRRAVTAPRPQTLRREAPAEPGRRRAPSKARGPGPPRWGTMEGGGEWKREREAAAVLGTPSRRKAPQILRKASRVAGGPGRRPLQGHVVHAGRCCRAPRVGRAAGEWTPGGAEGRGAGPCRRPPRPSALTTWRSQKRGALDAGTQLWPLGHPADPPPRRSPATCPSSPCPPRAPAPIRGSSPGSGVPVVAPHSSTPRSPQTPSSKIPPLPRTASSPPAGFYRDSGRRRLSSPSTKMAAGPEPRPQQPERVGGQRAGASSLGEIRTTSPRRPCALASHRLEMLAEACEHCQMHEPSHKLDKNPGSLASEPTLFKFLHGLFMRINRLCK
ncbi:uncharacterized protein [Vicugna pacos]|uniref:Basic proline-rich protein-like n=1 Tax=Vicugna pacos TaxID=30538 RepID=A0ABM5BWE7_VICPA